LGFAYLKQKNLDAAQKALMSTLTIAPSRAAAWGNLGDVFALKGDEIKAVACYSNTYRFSKDITKTHQFMKTMNATEDVSALKQARDVAMTLALKMYPNLQ
jgi:predicted Zn-dependent protease